MPGSWFTEGMNKNLNINVNDSQPGCHDMSSYHAVTVSSRRHLHISRHTSLQGPSMPYEDLPETYFAGHSGRATNMNKVYSQTYMYICCNCGDGPKVYNVQPRCTECNHIVCSSCKPVK
ncbi:hypothetical protein CNMCM8980_009210 [Aspergillus fumigatiaffinis]|uniref:Uncharacterized protein n=1 Tax=Aspergillus fumigatiaffinis TaxID=340414 RepID=A0A8H4GMK2_9EURO|nr:hypothetical protein CNMCM5878_009306 [Aspergillus fumigatiaffinis]KAF4224721.1 hypothetical protein CNMCM6457_009071 [Aspergillus fumigatiaffinis]KAF4233798.1 hypothetical protein CNMCM6805_009015 [Aspergillus fumigatiaffinis]KAF4245994.1 hypothetical protein CNMCM8980_009210 [Aspergillus fumigatiaffinis]